MNRVVFKSGSDEWKTPKAVYDSLNQEFQFNDDPCPLNEVWDGLYRPWGTSTFCNPPYSRIKHWIEHAYQEWERGNTVVLLIPSRTDTRWWHDYCMKATEIRFIKGRLRFGDAVWSARFPSCIFIFKGRSC